MLPRKVERIVRAVAEGAPDLIVAVRSDAQQVVSDLDAQRVRQKQRQQSAPRRKIPARSKKRIAEAPARAEVVRETVERAGHRCEGPGRGLPGRCASPFSGRPELEVHEVTARGTHPGSHLDASVTVALCQTHHDMCTSPVGDMRQLVEGAGLLVRAGRVSDVRNTKVAA